MLGIGSNWICSFAAYRQRRIFETRSERLEVEFNTFPAAAATTASCPASITFSAGIDYWRIETAPEQLEPSIGVVLRGSAQFVNKLVRPRFRWPALIPRVAKRTASVLDRTEAVGKMSCVPWAIQKTLPLNAQPSHPFLYGGLF